MKDKFFNSMGWFGNILLSIGVFPQVYETWISHNMESFSWSFLLMWNIGVILTFFYIWYDNYKAKKYQWPLLLNYLVNILGTGYLVFAKFAFA